MRNDSINITSEVHFIKENGPFPNNANLPVIIYRHVTETDSAHDIKKMLKENGWENSWVNGIFDYHHYHSTAHEVLVVVKGECEVQLGGDNMPSYKFETGDAVVIPAGVAHKNLGSSSDFSCVGAYPKGQDYNINYGLPNERPKADEEIRQVPLPTTDPIYGTEGPVLKYYK
jgi:uncharacterized protein YjlB